MRRTLIAPAVCLAALTLGACSRTPPSTASTAANTSSGEVTTTGATMAEKAPTRSGSDAVSATAGGEVHVKAGSSAAVSVRVIVSEGFHVNANPPSAPNLIATQIKLQPADGITSGKPEYPAPSATKKFQFSDTPLAVYEGTVTLRLPIIAAANTSKGEHTLKATVRAQPCDQEVCYPPRNLDITIPVIVD